MISVTLCPETCIFYILFRCTQQLLYSFINLILSSIIKVIMKFLSYFVLPMQFFIVVSEIMGWMHFYSVTKLDQGQTNQAHGHR